MKTSEAIKFFSDGDFTDDQGYNILISDLWEMNVVDKPTFEDQEQVTHRITTDDVDKPNAQAIIKFFMYQIQDVLFPAIRVARIDAAEGSPGIVK